MADKIYYPESILNNPLEGTEPQLTAYNPTDGGTLPDSTKGVDFQGDVIARELRSQSLNTMSRKILAEYNFSLNGALAVGTYVSGTSGDIRISPDGIVARNSSGTTTFAIDGTTGDATFFGTVVAGSLVAGYVQDVGGHYSTSATGSRVLILPDANTGIIAYASNGTSVIFKVETGGTNVGDVTIGDYGGGNGMLWDNSASTLKIKGDMTAGNISGVTITGSDISTGSSGTRVAMTSNSDAINWYDSGNDIGLTLQLVSTTTALIESKDTRSLSLTSASGTIEVNDILDLNSQDITGVGALSTTTLSMGGDIDMNGHYVNEITCLSFNTRSSNPSGNWTQWAYNSGGTYEMRVMLNGSRYAQSLISV